MAAAKWLKRLLGGASERPKERNGDRLPATETSGEQDDDDDGEPVAAGPKPSRPRVNAKTDKALEDEARALFDGNDAAAGISLLAERALMFARHEENGLPCLCRKCLKPDLDLATFGDVEFVRDFVVSCHRVFFYWMPAKLGDDVKQVRASMRGRVRQRLRERRLKGDEPRQVLNPFTQERVVTPPREEAPRVNPFTGKVIK